LFVHCAHPSLSSPYHVTSHPGLDERAFPSMSHDRERERGGDDGYDNVQQNYYQRSWGDHPDLRSLDGRSQASEGQGQGERRRQILFTPYSTLLYFVLRHSPFAYRVTACQSICPPLLPL
jgi:hypothetical protein